MILYVMRHGIAEDFAPGEMQSDSERRLTKEGRENMVLQAQGVAALRLDVGLFLTSPYVRARQTAQYVHEALGPDRPLEVADELVPHADPEAILELLAARELSGDVMLFGHEPHVSTLGALVLGGRHDAQIEMKRGALLGLEIARLKPPFRGVLRFLLPPRMLRALAR